MSDDPRSVPDTTKAFEAMQCMKLPHLVYFLPVVDSENTTKIVGLVTMEQIVAVGL